ncbi:MAG TPA: primosomal protein N' [Pirellulales bacterium]|nr:primosomal protein N' [Pirellulales bacterium]
MKSVSNSPAVAAVPQNKQQQLFDSEPAPWELDDAQQHWVATIVVPGGPPQELDYLVPEELRLQLDVGRRAAAPLGRGDRKVIGYCTRLEHRTIGARRLKSLLEVIDEETLVSPSMLRLTQWIAQRYLCPLGQVLETVVPAGVRDRAGTRLTTLLSVTKETAAQLGQLKLPKKQLQIMRYLAASSEPLTPAQLAQGVGCTLGPITVLRRKGLISSQTRRMSREQAQAAPSPREDNHDLNADQLAALDAILAALHARRHETLLLHGVTGSGKTEVYMRAIQEVVSFGRQAIVLVPEISLTPQAQQRFRARFGQVAVLHSHLTDAERHWQWQKIARGEVSVVVGARSAIFAPVPHLGLIILDEEHESSFKQDTAPRYHARDVASQRAAAENVPLVLGSATPSLESWQRAKTGEYRLLSMPRRVFDRPMPAVVTIDLRNESRDQFSSGALSRPLLAAMKECLEAGGQTILLLNRRGFSTHIQCSACGEVVRCPNCDIALTHHRESHIALCHYCDHEIPAPGKCAACGFAGIRYSGLGTQRLEAEVRARFPEYPMLRMDADTMRGPGSHEKALTAFRNGEVRILLGTQMIAKGLDFPEVTLVGVINADIALHLPDFRAAERTFQLLVQVAGRTGRGPKGGRVLVQTFNPDHAAIKAAVRHDYQVFAEQELPSREMLSYPPFASMARLVIRGEHETTAHHFAEHLSEQLTAALTQREAGARVLGPAPAPIAKLRGRYRFQIQVQSPHAERLREALAEVAAEVKTPAEVQWIIDIDPTDML